ncbi:class I SAM-dependent methyltransferase [Variovorax arabinosiphilus]|uniref:class I SAM-dependent methyltransferase n=1 Tax=Variovorax arabinosiphilus TaxID=3053498 RepID=UPI002576BDA8|nr:MULTISPECIES: class I SAM-dependent methyltransferase [unclassified Variovorax]MDM0119187.1 class I SAM-dependent methyltransferase [Variovorax sp. J2L1-78]MDM0129613.1 class I SAM-dependent methyltransferase [Variovorax sp. J2L1-63]MDM0232601.1 class I SAM-dependent methyltransferase [Variovorax sp. J2R1-6]
MSFGESASIYNATRLSYADEVVDRVAEVLGATRGRSILDIGCGTGIATRQLAARGFRTVGTDVDADMIEEARAVGEAGRYQVADASRLDFADAEFDGATAFGAFHWFSDEASVRSIQRVLRRGAAFVVVNKNDVGDFRESIVEIVSGHVALGNARPKLDYQPAKTLGAFGFEAVEEAAIPVIEHLPPTQALAHVRSMRLWEEVPPSLHDTVEAELRSYLASQLDACGNFQRRLSVAVVWGRKP